MVPIWVHQQTSAVLCRTVKAHRVGIVSKNTSEPRPEQRASSDKFQRIDSSKVEDGDDTRQEALGRVKRCELGDEFFNAFDCGKSEKTDQAGDQRRRLTDVNDANVHAKALAGEVGHITHVIGNVPDSKKPMEYSGPNADPAEKRWVESRIVDLDDIVDGVVEQGDQAGNADNSQRLGTENAEDHGGQSGSEQGLVDTELFVSTAIHVEDECQGWE